MSVENRLNSILNSLKCKGLKNCIKKYYLVVIGFFFGLLHRHILVLVGYYNLLLANLPEMPLEVRDYFSTFFTQSDIFFGIFFGVFGMGYSITKKRKWLMIFIILIIIRTLYVIFSLELSHYVY